MRRWKQSGQKHAGAPDIASMMKRYPTILWIFIISTYASCVLPLVFRKRRGFLSLYYTFAMGLLVASGVWFKIVQTREQGDMQPSFLNNLQIEAFSASLVTARAHFIVLAGIISFAILLQLGLVSRPQRTNELAKDISDHFSVFLIAQSRYENIPLFLLFSMQHYLGSLLSPNDPFSIATAFLIHEHASFFAMGNSNSLASVDLTNSYNGVQSFAIVLVGFLTFVTNWAGPIWWSIRLLHAIPNATTTNFFYQIIIMTVFFSVGLAAVMGCCIVLKSHLFIWTVFSPKFLYQTAWGIGFNQMVHIVFGGMLSCISLM